MEIRGEYWIHEDGWVDFADGDIGDKTHEGFVIDLVMYEIVSALAGQEGPGGQMQYDYGDEFVDWDEFTNDLEEVFGGEDEALKALSEAGVTDDQWAVANGMTDARIYGMKILKWKTVRGHHVETWTATPNDLKVIGHGIQEIIDQELGDSPMNPDQLEFYVNVFSTGQSKEFTLSQLLNGGIDPNMGRTMQLPSQASISLKNQGHTNIALNQIKDIDLKQMHPYYQGLSSPFGDNTILTFKRFLTLHN